MEKKKIKCKMKNSVYYLLILLSISFSYPPENEILKSLDKDPFFETQMIFEGERFPNIVVAKDGSVVATWGKENCVSRRSIEGGKSMQPQVSIGSGRKGGG